MPPVLAAVNPSLQGRFAGAAACQSSVRGFPRGDLISRSRVFHDRKGERLLITATLRFYVHLPFVRGGEVGPCAARVLPGHEAHGRKSPLTPLCQRGESGASGWTSSVALILACALRSSPHTPPKLQLIHFFLMRLWLPPFLFPHWEEGRVRGNTR